MVLPRAAVALALALAPMRAEANHGDELDLMAQLRSTSARERETAARTIASRAAAGDTASIFIASQFAVTDELRVRVLLVDALATAAFISPSTRAFVPLASVLERKLRQQLATERPERLPRAGQCSVTGWTPRGALLSCRADPICDDGVVIDRTYQITTGVRWEIEVVQRESRGNDRCARSPK